MNLSQYLALLTAGLIWTVGGLQAQCIQTANGRFSPDGSPCNNTIVTAVPFLRIVPDARFGALGDAGLALDADPNSMHFNPSNLAFAKEDLAISATYTPWLRALGLNDVYLAHLSGYMHLDKMQTVGSSLRFFSLGQVQYTDDQGNNLQQVRPREFEFSLAYARKLSERFSSSLAIKYIHSNLGSGVAAGPDLMLPANAFAADVSFTYRQPLKFNNGNRGQLNFGVAATNLGSKISYLRSADRDYIPANLGIGTAFTYELDAYNSFTFALDINKLMVPTPVPRIMEDGSVNPEWDADGDGIPDYKQRTVPSAIFSSFSDASFGEELRELMYSFGIEYWYNKVFAVRVGHYNEHRTKGNRKFMTAGVGLRYRVFNINFSYLFPTVAAQRNPLDNTLRFSLIFNFNRIEEAKKPAPKPAPNTTPSVPD